MLQFRTFVDDEWKENHLKKRKGASGKTNSFGIVIINLDIVITFQM